jgi:peptide deformylase
MSQKRKIITYPNPILEQVALPVDFPLSVQDKQLIADLWTTVAGEGVGLAAPQVGVSKQMCIIHLSDGSIGKKLKQKDILLINPQITFYSEVENLMIEGCLSFPGEYYEIWRPANIHVEYQDEQGKKQKLKASKWLARVIQHEIDHLQGKVYTKMGGKKIKEEDLNENVIVD